MESTAKQLVYLENIIRDRAITPVYQPIVNLSDGTVFGYEALSRIVDQNGLYSISKLFEIAHKNHLTDALEILCREQAMRFAQERPEGTLLFLNVDPNVILTKTFEMDMSVQRLSTFHIRPEEIVLEATERSDVADSNVLRDVTSNFSAQGFKIAVDDIGSGYSGLQRLCTLSPTFLKIDMAIIQGIHQSDFKQSLVRGLMVFAKEVNIKLVAEGIETREDLATVIKLGVHLGQGYYLQRPAPGFVPLDVKIVSDILNIQEEKQNPIELSFFGNMESLCGPVATESGEMPLLDLYNRFLDDETLSEVALSDDEGHFIGLIHRREISRRFGGRYGYILSSRRVAREILGDDSLVVPISMDMEQVAKMAMERSPQCLYDTIAVVDGEKLCGLVSIRDLLNETISLQVKRAIDCNPLTGLPGNVIIEKEVEKFLEKDNFFAICYIDLDNFKAYNDAYGFNNGDSMLKLVAKAMVDNCDSADFKGHIGGDDFIFITNSRNVEHICAGIIAQFRENLTSLYNTVDLERGYIISKNRSGFIEKFPMATLSIAVITNSMERYETVSKLSIAVAKVKKKAKKQEGNSIVVR